MRMKVQSFHPLVHIVVPVRLYISKAQSPAFNRSDLDYKPLKILPHTDIYIVDSSLVSGYMKNEIPGWKAWADAHISLGNEFLLLEQTVKEIGVNHRILPKGFEPLKVHSS